MSKPTYERPYLIKHAPGQMNKFSRVAAMQPMTHIDGVSVDALVEAYGSPLFRFSASARSGIATRSCTTR
jgi:hypothetical protein